MSEYLWFWSEYPNHIMSVELLNWHNLSNDKAVINRSCISQAKQISEEASVRTTIFMRHVHSVHQ